MSEITGQDEARRALADKILHEREYAKAHGFMMSTLWLTYEDAGMIAAALRAPSLDRGAEEMRERAAKLCDEEAWSQLHLEQALRDRERVRFADAAEGGREAAVTLASAIRALPVSADLNEGGEK